MSPSSAQACQYGSKENWIDRAANRTDWTREEFAALFALPFDELHYKCGMIRNQKK